MSFGNTLLSKLGLGEGGASSLLPLHTSPPSRPSEEHDLSELSPRPDDALLSPKFTREFGFRDSISNTPNGSGTNTPKMNGTSARSKGKGKAIAFAYQDRPRYMRTANSLDGYSTSTGGMQDELKVPPGIWRPNIQTEQPDSRHIAIAPHASFVESIFKGRPERSSDRMLHSEVDNTFKMLQRRERQMHKELQKLLDAQGAALERDLEGDDTRKTPSEDSRQGLSPGLTTSTIDSQPPGASVVPVRQPKRKPMSKRQARIGIARSVTMLADLKNEEDAYIATALAERKAALSRLRNLSTQRKSIAIEMKALEEDGEMPIKSEISAMEGQHRIICSNIEKLEEKLRVLRRTKAELERKLEEARSTRDASLSGYKGALRQCDQGITELMKYPGIQVLEIEDLKEQGGEDVAALMTKHMSGLEFLSLRPERRTMEMAKDWWEGEVAVLEQRKAAVDKERAALEEGSEIWQQAFTMLVDFETQLNQSLQAATKQRNFASGDPESILRDQYKALKKTLRELQKMHDYVEAQGWNLLIAAIGAELAHLLGLKDFLAELIRDSGYVVDSSGSVTPKTVSSDNNNSNNNLVDVREDSAGTRREGGEDEDEDDGELSQSVVRRWDAEHLPQRSSSVSSPPADLLAAPPPDDSSDNEVPPGLLSEARPEHHDGSEGDERERGRDRHIDNDIPAEFLSMHSPPQLRKAASGGGGARLRRASSEERNDIPPGLLSESRREDSGVD